MRTTILQPQAGNRSLRRTAKWIGLGLALPLLVAVGAEFIRQFTLQRQIDGVATQLSRVDLDVRRSLSDADWQQSFFDESNGWSHIEVMRSEYREAEPESYPTSSDSLTTRRWSAMEALEQYSRGDWLSVGFFYYDEKDPKLDAPTPSQLKKLIELTNGYAELIELASASSCVIPFQASQSMGANWRVTAAMAPKIHQINDGLLGRGKALRSVGRSADAEQLLINLARVWSRYVHPAGVADAREAIGAFAACMKVAAEWQATDGLLPQTESALIEMPPPDQQLYVRGLRAECALLAIGIRADQQSLREPEWFEWFWKDKMPYAESPICNATPENILGRFWYRNESCEVLSASVLNTLESIEYAESPRPWRAEPQNTRDPTSYGVSPMAVRAQLSEACDARLARLQLRLFKMQREKGPFATQKQEVEAMLRDLRELTHTWEGQTLVVYPSLIADVNCVRTPLEQTEEWQRRIRMGPPGNADGAQSRTND